MIQQDYPSRVYAGLLGKCIGVRLGAPVEPTVWTYDRIKETYGDITGYIKDYKNFAADDDVNGPVFFIRALNDYGKDREITCGDIGNCWLNYTREGKGFYWWGGYGRSTEHTAYLNLKNGIQAPMSGSIKQNGETIAEQIGGQIFIDSWGLVCPGDPEKAAYYGEMAASVSHDRNGIYGGRFIAAAVAAAFAENDPSEIIKTALSFIPKDSEYARVVNAVVDFHRAAPEDFRECRMFLERNFGYDRYPGVCHIIPNAGVCILALLYGEGELARTVEIATMCGWDTDCNAGNVGTVIGTAAGLAGIPEKYRGPINDFHAASSIVGSLNIIDLPTEAKELALLGYSLAGETPPQALEDSANGRKLVFDFPFKGTTHGFRSADTRYLTLKPVERNGRNALEALVDRLPRYNRQRLFYKPFYRRSDFSDERYMPAFSPQVYPGQEIKVTLEWQPYEGPVPALCMYARKTVSGEILEGLPFFPAESAADYSWIIPDTGGEAIDEIGIIVEGREKALTFGKLFVYRFEACGKGRQVLDFSLECIEFDTVTQTTYDGGAWLLEKGGVTALSPGINEMFTGNFYTEDVCVKCPVSPENGGSHMLVLRARGKRHAYYAGFNGENRVCIIKNDNGITTLAEAEYVWKTGTAYEMEASAEGAAISLRINGETVLTVRDPQPYKHGMYGLGQLSCSRTFFGTLTADEI